jgi:hypothetical protein
MVFIKLYNKQGKIVAEILNKDRFKVVSDFSKIKPTLSATLTFIVSPSAKLPEYYSLKGEC